jgi:methylene-tetrahydromethanopterin dehydrogenase
MERKYLLYMFTTDDYVSPFDINMAYDIGFDVVIPYAHVTPQIGGLLVQDIIFSRGVSGTKYSSIFIGGSDLNLAEDVWRAVEKNMFPPFQVSIMIDPKGAYSTASALVAKVERSLEVHKMGSLAGKNVVILGGTGPVGRIAAVLCAKNGCRTTIVETDPSRSPQFAETVAKMLGERYGVSVAGAYGWTSEEKLNLLKEAHLIFSTAKAGIQVLSKDLLGKLPPDKIMADVNAVRPEGIEGLAVNQDLGELMPGIVGIGALVIGDLKYKVEMDMLDKIRTMGKMTVVDYQFAYEAAKKRLQE